MVIAHCDEELEWLEVQAPRFRRVYIYTKCKKQISARHRALRNVDFIVSPNVGSNDYANLQHIIQVAPEVVSHNLETVRRLTKSVRIQAKYDRSLEVIKRLSDAGLRTKSGVMLGLGETFDEVVETMDDLRSVGCQVITLGQYLQPTPKHLPVVEFIHPDVFAELEAIGKEKGFRHVESGPLVRSSYHAEKHVV